MGLVGEGIDELPVPVWVSIEDVSFAVTAIVVHASGPGPDSLGLDGSGPDSPGTDGSGLAGSGTGGDGRRCGFDGAPHPCRLYRWGQRVLARRGLSEAEIARLVAEQRRGEAGR